MGCCASTGGGALDPAPAGEGDTPPALATGVSTEPTSGPQEVDPASTTEVGEQEGAAGPRDPAQEVAALAAQYLRALGRTPAALSALPRHCSVPTQGAPMPALAQAVVDGDTLHAVVLPPRELALLAAVLAWARGQEGQGGGLVPPAADGAPRPPRRPWWHTPPHDWLAQLAAVHPPYCPALRVTVRVAGVDTPEISKARRNAPELDGDHAGWVAAKAAGRPHSSVSALEHAAGLRARAALVAMVGPPLQPHPLHDVEVGGRADGSSAAQEEGHPQALTPRPVHLVRGPDGKDADKYGRQLADVRPHTALARDGVALPPGATAGETLAALGLARGYGGQGVKQWDEGALAAAAAVTWHTVEVP